MTLRILIRTIPAASLGVTAALLVSCGSSGTGLIPAANAGPLQGDFEAVAKAAQEGNGSCVATETALGKTEQDFLALPASVDKALRGRLDRGITNLRARALAMCAQPAPSATTTTPTQTTTTTTQTPTTSTSTETTTTSTTPTTPATTPTAPTAPTPPGQGGGTEAPEESPESNEGEGKGKGQGKDSGAGAGGISGGAGPGGGQ